MTYTLTAVLGVLAALVVDRYVTRRRLVTRRSFWLAYAIVLFFQLVVNGLLTGLEIVRYDPARIVGLRIAFAPVEDLLFGFAMVLLTLTTWVWAGSARAPSADGHAARRAGR
ncbi:lycopene cyclase domain-containing protein [Jatrophihabitans endophyticus]|uniref:Lycopene cyclase domain-containing protein n=1 Tax=Jatrophihabitans endophyticus TaxID=1206085 RepID=A0A1M5L643_9ACTN|nr:lycopene cyclase domain-containing protein [Jatrophihabitans endophyticus]SHG60552.1 lycopene cyclase domain-containing protein [Jatrophihabitans endophyticus]